MLVAQTVLVHARHAKRVRHPSTVLHALHQEVAHVLLALVLTLAHLLFDAPHLQYILLIQGLLPECGQKLIRVLALDRVNDR